MDEAAQSRDFGAGTEANARITPVLLCGGAGMRLWPVSRADMPKQFAQLGSERTLFQETLLRVARETFEAPVLVTSARHRFLAAEQAGELAPSQRSSSNPNLATPPPRPLPQRSGSRARIQTG